MADSPLLFTSDDTTLNRGFGWAKAQALAYVFEGDPVGEWYEAALPGRAAFCMRDVSHQATGAHVLGLARWNYNMLHRFAENITAERDWCSLWEIDKRSLPCPADYRDDRYFWYNFPANFDVLDCCFRQYLWSGNPCYLDDSAFRFFYAKSVNNYVHTWDRDHDGLMEHDPAYGFRGIATYNEEVPHPRIGGDLIAAQYGGYRAYAEMMALEGRAPDAELYQQKARALQTHYARHWWDAAGQRVYGFVSQEGAYLPDFGGLSGLLGLYFGLITEPERISAVLDRVIAVDPQLGIESRSYIPEVLYRYGRKNAAYASLCALFDPDMPRREYPEVSYALLGALSTGLMGVQPDARERLVRTRPALTDHTGWAQMDCIPVFDNLISLRHQACTETSLTNQSGRPFYWKAAFSGTVDTLEVDGKLTPAAQDATPAGVESYVILRVTAGETHTVKILP